MRSLAVCTRRVQELAGLSFQMAAAVDQERSEPELRRILIESGAGTRNAIRQLRSLLLEIYPAALSERGLAAALSDLVAPLTARDIEVEADVEPHLALPTETEQLLFRVAQEAVRNIVAHAAADRVTIHVAGDDGVATLRVVDNGRGFDVDELDRRRVEGHIGLAVLRDIAESAGGELILAVVARRRDDDRTRGAGTVIRVAVIDDHTIVRNGLTQLIESDPESSSWSAPRRTAKLVSSSASSIVPTWP